MSHVKHNGLEGSKGIGSEMANSVNSEWLDDVFHILSNSRRRAVIQIMLEHERIDFGTLVDRVAELEYQLPQEEIDSSERHTIYVSLQQTHCQTLEEKDIITRDRDTGSVGLGPNADELADYLAKIDGEDSLGSKLKRTLPSF